MKKPQPTGRKGIVKQVPPTGKARRGIETLDDVCNWFGNRGVHVEPSEVKLWRWDVDRLFYVIDGKNYATEPGLAEYTYTHRDDGSPIIIFEPYGELPIEDVFGKRPP